MGDVLIDLGEARGPAPSPTARPVPRRAVLALLAVAMLATLTGGAHRVPPPGPTAIPARLGDTMFVTSDRLFVVSREDPARTAAVETDLVSAYALPSGRLESRTTVAVTGQIYFAAAAGATLIVSYRSESADSTVTVALTAGGDRALWRRSASVIGISVPDSLLLLQTEDAGPGEVYQGVDLATGRRRWSVRVPGRVDVTAALADPETGETGRTALITAVEPDGRLTVRSSRTGATIAATTVPTPVGPLWQAGDSILVGVPGGTMAYRTGDLTRLWRTSLDLTGSWVNPSCAAIICVIHRSGGTTAVDAATGRKLWRSYRWSATGQVGDNLLAYPVYGGSGPVDAAGPGILDPATGRVLGTFDKWTVVNSVASGGDRIGLREESNGPVAWYGRIDLDSMTVRLIGAARDVSGDCQTTRDVLVCRRMDASIGIWPLK
ncbi:outer membrane protein assembly factor BamB family protein [Mangrovihabitans endophyticus]|uniref:Pyrrolo-quinoline quinone repeat domain-containing protein n=1 Tax=Mangrovihabitans endophyticus TaxID=1751298 RepID=A0A8J3FR95_9ACTN|nr:PQQ-binding-like beta-propeller repeat protein [Mangrovihabitans endophyticus]GGL13938.1 hypothetical protein GCM10012284_55890 [Mangrovihabitans endophyticus]